MFIFSTLMRRYNTFLKIKTIFVAMIRFFFRKLLFLTLFFCLIITRHAFAQNFFSAEMQILLLKKNDTQKNIHANAYKGLLRFYKTFISSQDIGSCVFIPSCSVYSYRSIKKRGLVIGLFATADRLCRCHPYDTKWYKWDDRTQHLEDEE